MEAAVVHIKQEKIDPEIEQKIKGLDVQVKKEPLEDINLNTKAEESSDSDSSSEPGSNAEDETEDKKNVELVKTSNELLAELFQVFNAAPPEELLNDEDLLKKTKEKAKKLKKAKKKKHKRHKTSAEDASDAEKKDKHKHKKKKKHKHKDDEKKRDRSKSTEKEKHKTEKSEKSTQKSKDREHKSATTEGKESNKGTEIVANINIKKERNELDTDRKRRSSPEKNSEPPAKVHRHANNNFYNGYKPRDERIKIKLEKPAVGNDQRRHSNRNSKDHQERNELSDISLSDEETYLRERDRIAESTISGDRQRQHNYESHHQRDRRRRPIERIRRRSRSRSVKRSTSRSRDLGIDKKRLLEIARKNAISMFKRGNLPGCANMSEDVKDKVLLQMRYGGRTVQDLTDFCRKISNGEPLPDLSSDNDSDVDKDGNTRAFHHPFQLKEREPIVMQIRNAVPIVPAPTRKEEQTKAITMQFPVSSGQQHRISENWIPVEAKPPQSAAPLTLQAATQSTNIFKQTAPKNIFEKPIPAAEQQEAAFRPAVVPPLPPDPVVTTPTNTALLPPIPNTAPPPVVGLEKDMPPAPFMPAQPTAGKEFVPDVPIPSSAQSDSIFPDPNSGAMDVSSIISKRLSALRRLQENPMDSEAIKMMYNSQKEMSSWASSKHIPGQFTGSTGANILKAHELNSGPQVWARRDQLTSTKPVTGGMGMHLLQKMGWKPGEGLGREKKGALQPLLLDVKLDKRGLVAKDDHAGVNGTKPCQPTNNKKRQNNIGEMIQTFQNKHPVCILNEITSKRKWTPPLYQLVSEGGAPHNKKFLFSVSMNGQTFTPNDGSNTKKEAKMIAARFCLEQIGILPTANIQ